jgi:hypothetical protein
MFGVVIDPGSTIVSVLLVIVPFWANVILLLLEASLTLTGEFMYTLDEDMYVAVDEFTFKFVACR